MRTSLSFAALLATFAAAGCAAQARFVAQPGYLSRAGTDPSAIEVLGPEGLTKKAHRLGSIQALGGLSQDDALAAMKPVAARYGCDALGQPVKGDDYNREGPLGANAGKWVSACYIYTWPDWAEGLPLAANNPGAALPSDRDAAQMQ